MRSLEKANPEGRLDVLLYNAARVMSRNVEAKFQLDGLWSELGPHIEELVKDYVGDEKVLKLSPLTKSLLRKAGVLV